MKQKKVEVQVQSTEAFTQWVEAFSEAVEKLNGATREIKTLLAERPKLKISSTAAEESE